MKKINALALVMLIVLSYALTIFVACNPYATKPQKPTEHKHSLTYVAAVEETCTQDGMLEHWECDSCGKTFSDSKGEHEVQKSSLVVSAHHTLTHKTEQKATCTADGNIDYYHCSACGENFLDENGKNRVDLDDTVLASKGHVVGDQWEHDKNGHWKVCSACGEIVDYASHNFEDYVCKDCGAEDEQNKPMSEEEKIQKIMDLTKSCIQNTLGKTAIINSYIAIDFKVENGENNLYLLVDNDHARANGTFVNYLNFVRVELNNELNDSSLKANNVAPKEKYAESLFIFPKTEQNEQISQILDKLSIEEKFDYVGIKNNGGGFWPDLGDSINGIELFMINGSNIKSIRINIATNHGLITDAIELLEKQFLNGTLNSTYALNNPDNPIKTEYEFSDNAILNFDALSPEEQATFDILYEGKKVGYAKGNVMCYQLEQ